MEKIRRTEPRGWDDYLFPVPNNFEDVYEKLDEIVDLLNKLVPEDDSKP